MHIIRGYKHALLALVLLKTSKINLKFTALFKFRTANDTYLNSLRRSLFQFLIEDCTLMIFWKVYASCSTFYWTPVVYSAQNANATKPKVKPSKITINEKCNPWKLQKSKSEAVNYFYQLVWSIFNTSIWFNFKSCTLQQQSIASFSCLLSNLP